MTFPTGVDFRKYSDEELTTMLAEAGEASKHARKRGRVMGIVAAHRLEQMKEILLYNELAIWRRENGFDRVEAVEKNRFGDHRPLLPTSWHKRASGGHQTDFSRQLQLDQSHSLFSRLPAHCIKGFLSFVRDDEQQRFPLLCHAFVHAWMLLQLPQALSSALRLSIS